MKTIVVAKNNLINAKTQELVNKDCMLNANATKYNRSVMVYRVFIVVLLAIIGALLVRDGLHFAV